MKIDHLLILALFYTSVFFAGLVPWFSAVIIAISAVGIIHNLVRLKRINKISLTVVILIIYLFISALLFGGLSSIGDKGFLYWISNEGRIFLFFMPFLFFSTSSLVARISVDQFKSVARAMIALNALMVVLEIFLGISLFRSHHAHGAISALFFIISVVLLSQRRKPSELIYVIVALVCLMASDSRTSLLAALLSLLPIFLNSMRPWRIALSITLIAFLLPMMPVLFPDQYKRLSASLDGQTLVSMQSNFIDAIIYDKTPEVSILHTIGGSIRTDGNANLAIRSALWGRALREGALSPLFGIGFGRFNDLGRQWAGPNFILRTVESASYASASNLTAHNTFLHYFVELGLIGLVLLLTVVFMILSRRGQYCRYPDQMFYRRLSQACLFYLLLTGLTQHSFGAPIYGLSMMATIGFCMRISSSGVRAAENTV